MWILGHVVTLSVFLKLEKNINPFKQEHITIKYIYKHKTNYVLFMFIAFYTYLKPK